MTSTEVIRDDLLLELVTDLLGSGREACFAYSGKSMHPVIHTGNMVTVSPVSLDNIRPGQILLYLPVLPDGSRGMVLHRYLGRNPDNTLRMRADACPVLDPPVNADDVVGRVVRIRKSRFTLRADRLPGSLLLGSSTRLPLLLSYFTCLHEAPANPANLPLVAIPSSRLSRERLLLQIASGEEEPLLSLEENNSRLQLDAQEACMLPLIVTRAQEAMVEIGHLLESPGGALCSHVDHTGKAENALRWLESILKENDIQLLLTGPTATAWEYYPKPHCRPFDTITCMILPEQRETMVEVMLKAGAALADPHYPLSHVLTRSREITLRLPAPSWPLLTMNWRGCSTRLYNRRMKIDRYWEDTRESIFGEPLRLMRVEAEIVFTFLHLAHLLPQPGPIWAADILFLAGRKPDWDQVFSWLERCRLGLPGAVAANWMHLLAPGTIPVEFVQSVTDLAARTSGIIERRIMRTPDTLLAGLYRF